MESQSAQTAKGEAFYINSNNFKKSEKAPDMIGKLMLTKDQLKALIEIYELARESGEQPQLQIDIAGWKGTGKTDGKPYLYCKPEVYFGERKAKKAAPQKYDEDEW